MHRRTKTTVFIVVLVLLLLAGAIYLTKQAPPEAARLLPESDAIVYVDLRPLRAATRLDQHPVKHDADYQPFIDATGIQFERDLEQAAFALHRMPNPLGPNGPVAFSTVFVGKFDGRRLSKYLDGVAESKERYDGHDIYNISNDGRTDRVALLGYDMVAVSNTPTPEQIHSILDRHRTAALPFAGCTLLSQHYRDVPLLSQAWGIGKLGIPLGSDGGLRVFGMRIPLSLDATFIASLRWAGALRLRIEEIAPNSAAAAVSASSIGALLSVFKAAEDNLPDAMINPDTKSLVDSATIEHHKDRAVLTATLPPALLQKAVTAPETLQTFPAPRQGGPR